MTYSSFSSGGVGRDNRSASSRLRAALSVVIMGGVTFTIKTQIQCQPDIVTTKWPACKVTWCMVFLDIRSILGRSNYESVAHQAITVPRCKVSLLVGSISIGQNHGLYNRAELYMPCKSNLVKWDRSKIQLCGLRHYTDVRDGRGCGRCMQHFLQVQENSWIPRVCEFGAVNA